MTSLLLQVIFALGALSGAALVYWTMVFLVLRRSVHSVPTLRAGLDREAPGSGWPHVAIIIPAHNEQRVIGALARSLLAQDYPDFIVVFALDRCSDDTRAVIEDAIGDDPRFEIVEIEACPDDWAGKTHAAHAGVRRSIAASRAELLLFADADTEFAPGCLRAAVAMLLERNADLLSLLSTLTCRRWWERVVQPVAAFELLRHFPIKRVNDPDGARAFANGQFMLFRRDAYDRIGGHEAVKSELLEDIAFARRIRRAQKLGEGRGPALLLADGLLRCRMYAEWGDFVRGWKRIFTESAVRRSSRLHRWATQLLMMAIVTPAVLLLGISAGLAGLWLAPDSPAGAFALLTSIPGLLVWLSTIVTIHRIQQAPLWTALLHPLGAWLVRRILHAAARDLDSGTGTEWGGRIYAREQR